MTTQEFVQRARLRCDAKRTVSVHEMDRWLQELAAAGILVRAGNDWRPTPIGQLWLAPIAEAFVDDEALTAWI